MTLFPKCAIRAKMKTFLVILLCFFAENVPLTRGVECPPSPQRMDIKDTDVGVDFIALSLPSTATFIKLTIQDNTAINASTAITYFTAGIADSTFTVSTTDAFKNLGIDADSNGDKMIVFTMYAELTCENTNLTTIIVLRVSDTYSHNPQLPAEAYTYSIPMPIMTKTDITIYGDEINITDINFSNTEMTLSVSPDDFAITAAKTDNKHFKAVFSARSILQFSEDQNYVLTASNSGGKTSTAQITIKVDPVAGLDAPSFTKSYYSFDYSDEGQGSLTPKDGNIGIKSDKSNEAQYKLDGDLASSFKITFFNESLTFQLVLDTPLPSDIYGQVVLTLSYTTDATTNAILLVNIVKTEVIPKFSKDYYAGTYDVDTDDMSWAQEISIANASEVKLAEGKSNLFTIDKSTYKITPVNPLSKSDFDDNSNIIFKVIAASSSKNESQAVVVVSLKTVVSEELQFDRAFYSATYSIQNEAGVVTLDTDIGFLEISDFTGINVQVDDAYKANFKVGVDSSKWKISVPIPLNDTILNRNTELAIPIVATKTGLSVQASAVLILTLPEQVQIKFGNSYYTGSYSLGTDSDSVELDQKINISGDKLNNIKITVEGYENNFEVKLNSDASSYEIIVKINLNPTILNAGTVLPLKLKASTAKGSSTDNTVVILKFPEEKLDFHFKKSHYQAAYNMVSETEFNVTVNEAIEMIDAENVQLQFSFEDFEDNFALKLNPETSSYEISVINKLNSTVLQDNTELIITITAFKTDDSYTSSTVLILNLPSRGSSFKFAKHHYSAAYSIDADSKGIVTLNDGPIEITDASHIELQFSWEGFEKYLSLKYDSQSSSYQISVERNLNSSVLQDNTELVITITASKTDDSYTSSTVLILNLPSSGSSFKFAKHHYSAAYSIDADSKGVVTLNDGPIDITDASDIELQFSCEGFETYLTLKYDSQSSSYQISVERNLNSSVLQDNTELVITITAFKTDDSYTSSTVLILNLPSSGSSFKFAKHHYSAAYSIDADSKGVVTLNDGPIDITDASDIELQFSWEGFEKYLSLKYDSQSSSYQISVEQNLDSSVLQDKTELIITITAFKTDDSYTSSTVLILNLPSSGSSFKFAKHHYSAAYSIDADSKGVVTLNDGPIEITDASHIELQFSWEGFEKYLSLKYDSQSSSYQISVEQNLNSSVLQDKTELIITITAFKTDDSYTSSTVLILNLPSSGSSFKFAKHHYSAAYSIDANSKGVVTLNDGPIEITDASDIELQFSCEEYDKNFELALDESGTLSIQVKQNLNSSVLESHHQLIITITASATNGGATADTVLILDLPDVERKLAFSEKYYTAFYQTDSGGSVQLDEAIAVNSKGYTNIQVAFESLEDNFEFESASPSGSYSIKVKKPLNDTVLALNNQLVIVITASDLDSTASTSAILLIKLPSFSNNAFENEHYVAEYKSSTDSASKDEVNVIGDRIKVKTADYSSISFAGYEGNFEGTCDSSTLECVITVKSNLNGSILSSNDELLVTLIASNADRSNIGKTVLMLTLPSKNSTFSFSKQHYGAIYSIQKSNDVKATIELSDVISLQGAESADVSILVDDYPEYFKITLDSSIYNINILKNLDISLLSAASELVTSLTANKTGQNTQDYAKATLVIKLPDSTTVAFKKPQYYGEYVIDDPSNPQVVLDSDSPIEASDFENSKIVLDSFTENFAVELGSDSKWNVNSKISLNSSILSQYSELKLVMTITKIGVSYGNAALNIRLPSLSFAKNLYWGSYSVDDSGVGSISDIEIEIANVDPSYIEINLTRYSENFYTELTNNKWTVKIGTPLPAVTSGPLVINLEATRISDNKILATTVLVIRLPNENVADAPKFSNYTFFGNYKNSDVPTVELRELIGLSDDSTDSECEIFIDSTDEYSTNFSLKVEDNDQYSVNVATPLSQDVLDNLTNVVFTLVAKSTEGKYGFAALVISLPKALRNTSVQVEDEEILFTGTYQDGAFKSPRITLKTNSTDSDDISVKISNDLGIDDSYFTSSYSDGVLLIQVGELPQDVLNKTSVIPLKLAITDRSTQDTVRAVLNIEIDGNSDDNSGHGGNATDSAHVGLLVAVIILAVLLLLLLLGAFLFWFFKLRGTRSADMTDDELSITTKSTSFTKNEIKKPTTGLSSASIRRPTGLPIGLMNTVAEESTSDQGVLVSVDKSPYSEFEKKVAFDDKVENIDQDENDDDNDESSEGLQSVADRRPTKFVFGYPLEAGLFDEEDGRRESSDCITNPEGEDELPAGERKKSVAFDENIERMHIDRVEDDEDEEESGSEDNNKEEPNSTEDSFKTEAKLQVGGDEKLPSEIFKEIF